MSNIKPNAKPSLYDRVQLENLILRLSYPERQALNSSVKKWLKIGIEKTTWILNWLSPKQKIKEAGGTALTNPEIFNRIIKIHFKSKYEKIGAFFLYIFYYLFYLICGILKMLGDSLLCIFETLVYVIFLVIDTFNYIILKLSPYKNFILSTALALMHLYIVFCWEKHQIFVKKTIREYMQGDEPFSVYLDSKMIVEGQLLPIRDLMKNVFFKKNNKTIVFKTSISRFKFFQTFAHTYLLKIREHSKDLFGPHAELALKIIKRTEALIRQARIEQKKYLVHRGTPAKDKVQLYLTEYYEEIAIGRIYQLAVEKLETVLYFTRMTVLERNFLAAYTAIIKENRILNFFLGKIVDAVTFIALIYMQMTRASIERGMWAKLPLDTSQFLDLNFHVTLGLYAARTYELHDRVDLFNITEIFAEFTRIFDQLKK